ncbi:hypothetical protein QBC39DRAFT_337885 [Podospora conica]|nr:hypothetical protein QBC39DRAFT_337885 [Schizothecium conicum]
MDATPQNGLGKLLPRSLTAKRRRNKTSSLAASDTVSLSSAEDAASLRARSIASRDGPEPSRHDRDHQAQGQDSQDDKSRDSKQGVDSVSYYSDDADDDSLTRPTTFSTHPSQVGHLTTSSPLVQAIYHPESQPSGTLSSALSRSSTLQLGSVDSLESGHSSLRASKTGLTPPQSLSKQSSTSRLRDVFRSKKTTENIPSEENSPRTVATDKKTDPVPVLIKLDTESQNGSVSSTKTSSSERIRRLSKSQNIEPLRVPPTTPPPAEGVPPVIVNTPPTPTLPEQPAAPSPASPGSKSNASSPGNMSVQRRRAGSGPPGPSKLSNITPAPLTPTPESGPGTPGNTAATFFSSMFTAVQNTANTLSNSIANTNLQQPALKGRVVTPRGQMAADQNSVEVESSSDALPTLSTESKEPAVKTLGMGDLSLSQLGIVDTPAHAPSPVISKIGDSDSRTRSESAPADAHAAVLEMPNEDIPPFRPRSLYEPGLSGDVTPPQGSLYEGKSGVQRSGSIRSAIDRRRNRGSSAATGNTVSAIIASANSSLANPVAQPTAPKLTGFAVASGKRNRDFHALFKTVPDEDYLIEDYSCALQKEILAHGRLYVSEGHLCFSSNILGWITTLVISFDEIVAVEKRSTALVFKNGLEISTLHAKHIFASFTSRDTTYDLIIKIWQISHPHLQSTLNGVRLEETGGDRTEKMEAAPIPVSIAGSNSGSASDVDSDGEDDDEIYDEDEDEDDAPESTQTFEPFPDAPAEKAVPRKVSGAVAPAAEKQEDGGAPGGTPDFPGPATHAPTDCGDAAVHYDKVIGDDVVAAPLGKVYNILFGPASAAWMGRFLSVDQKCTEVQMEDKRGLTDDIKTRTFSYIKPLSAPIGPKSTKCIVTEQLESCDLEKSVNVSCTTQNPDVPSGNIFVVKTRYCLSWAENNSTRIQMNCTIEWSGKSWLKGPIERGANDGQTQYSKDLLAALRGSLSSRPKSGAAHGGGLKGRKRLRKKAAMASNTASEVEGLSKVLAKSEWGILEPARPFLGPVVGAIRPILTGNVVYGLLVGLLVASWFRSNRPVAVPFGRELGYAGYPQRMAAYEEMWRSEESDLWDWIEDRAGLDRLGGEPLRTRRRVGVEPRTVEEKLREEKMDERELREAIGVTEAHLKVLKSVMEREQEK